MPRGQFCEGCAEETKGLSRICEVCTLGSLRKEMPFSCGICVHFGSDDSGIPCCLHNGECERGEAFTPKAKEEKKLDIIEKAPHYNMGEFEAIDVIKDTLTPEEYRGFLKGNALKYLLRERYKGKVQDLKKTQNYLKRLVDGDGE